MNKNKNNILYFLIAVLVLILVFFVFYFNIVIQKQRIEMQKIREGIYFSQKTDNEHLFENDSFEKEGIVNRFFLSEIKIIDGFYTPTIHTCLFDEKGNATYSLYVYENWSILNYPDLKPEISLVRYRLFTEDDAGFQPNKACYIKEIKTNKDWQEVREKYNFSKDRFIQ